MASVCHIFNRRICGKQGGRTMAMTRRYYRVTHRPAALVFTGEGRLVLSVVGLSLGLFVGLHLPRKGADAAGHAPPTPDDPPPDA